MRSAAWPLVVSNRSSHLLPVAAASAAVDEHPYLKRRAVRHYEGERAAYA